jgi:P27 family predicted phage terminase small subunit
MPRDRKSDELHALEGTSTGVAPETGTPGSRPRVPKDCDAEEQKVFRQVRRELEKRRTVTSADAELIRLVAVLIVRHIRAMAHVREEGEIVAYPRMNNHGEVVMVPKRNMWLDIAIECESKIAALLDRLGFTPMNRPRVRPTKDEDSHGMIFR